MPFVSFAVMCKCTKTECRVIVAPLSRQSRYQIWIGDCVIRVDWLADRKGGLSFDSVLSV